MLKTQKTLIASVSLLSCLTMVVGSTPSFAVDMSTKPPAISETASPTPSGGETVFTTDNTSSNPSEPSVSSPTVVPVDKTVPNIQEGTDKIVEPSTTPSLQSTTPNTAAIVIELTGVIKDRFTSDGGYNKTKYGNPIEPQVQKGDVIYQRFERGTLVYSPSTGVHLMYGAIHDKWLKAGGVDSRYGIPTSEEVSQNLGRGFYQNMKHPKTGGLGVMTWNDWGSGTQYVYLNGGIGGHWLKNGSYKTLGYPMSEEECGFIQGACFQRFETGTIVWTPQYGSVIATGGIRGKWVEQGEMNAHYGVPITNEVSIGNGRIEQKYLDSRGRVSAFYWSPWTGSHHVFYSGGIGGKWLKNSGANGYYGLPTSDEQCGFVHGACFQDFEKVTIVWTPKWGTYILHGAIRGKWKESGWMQSGYGIPVSDERVVGNNQVEQLFVTPNGRDGAMYWTDQGTGTNFVYFGGAIGSSWASNGNFRQAGVDTPKRFGFPVMDEYCSNGYCHQKFQYGIVTWDNYGGGTHALESQKCNVLNDGRSRYSAQGANRVALALAPRYSNYRNDPGGYQGMFYSCRNVYGKYVQDWKTQASFGENGFLAPNRRIYDYETGVLLPPGVTGSTSGAYSPTGSFKLSQPFGLQNPGSGFSGYRTLNPNSRWGGDRNTWYYNKYIENPYLGYPNENMWNFAIRGDYRQGILANYNVNDDGSVPSGTAGFAIFLHTIPVGSTVYSYPTWGCVAISHDRMIQFLREGRDGDRIIMGVESEVIR